MTSESIEAPYIIAGICCTNCGKHVPIINNRGECTCGTSWTIDQPTQDTRDLDSIKYATPEQMGRKVYQQLPVTLSGDKAQPWSSVKMAYLGTKPIGLIHISPRTHRAIGWSADWGDHWWKGNCSIQEAITRLLSFRGYISPHDNE